MPDLSQLPSISNLLKTAPVNVILDAYGRTLSLKAVRTVLDEIRQSAQAPDFTLPNESEIVQRVRNKLAAWLEPTLTSVINATGVVLHTNLGRAPLSSAARAAINEAGASYSNLEFNLDAVNAVSAPCMPVISYLC